MTTKYLKCLKRKGFPPDISIIQRRPFLHWLTIMFNRVDTTRLHKFGPDRACAEWCLRNGAAIQCVGSKIMLSDYNSLPKEGTNFHIKRIDATDSSISHHGFLHLEGCNHINEFILVSCGYIENEALKQLSLIKKSLYYLKISKCGNITEDGLQHLKNLTQLRSLHLFNLDYVQDKQGVLKMLKSNLPNCQVTHDF